MSNSSYLESLSEITESIIQSPFEWCHVPGGIVVLEGATQAGGTKGGTFQVNDFAISKYPITNTQYESFLKHSNGFSNTQWWEYSRKATQWRLDHKKPKPTAFNSPDLPRTRVSWFDSMALCFWLSTELRRTLQPTKAWLRKLGASCCRLATAALLHSSSVHRVTSTQQTADHPVPSSKPHRHPGSILTVS